MLGISRTTATSSSKWFANNGREVDVGDGDVGSTSSKSKKKTKRNEATIMNDTGNDGEGDEEDRTRRMLQDEKFLQRSKRWVVIVDDEEAIRKSVGDYLHDQGYQVAACADADAMLELCGCAAADVELDSPRPPPLSPDAIVSDIRMPGKDGIALLRLIRDDERLKRIPVILLTAKAMTQDRIAGYRAGADVYLPKPFNPDELLSVLDNAILRQKQMKGKNGVIVDLKQEMAEIKQIMQRNADRVVKKTNVYLTPREREVLELLSKGYTNAEIAAERGVSVDGVVRTVQKLYAVTETRTRTELLRWAIETGYVARR